MKYVIDKTTLALSDVLKAVLDAPEAENSDFDSCTEPGIYNIMANVASNSPDSSIQTGNWTCICISAFMNTSICQYAISPAAGHAIYMRNYINGAFDSWV